VVVGDGPGAIGGDITRFAQVTHLSVVASQLRRLLADELLTERMRTLRCVLLGGGPTPGSMRAEAIARGWPLRVSYGLTECASQVATGIARVDALPTDAGEPLPGVQVASIDGELCVRGATLFLGYLDQQARDPEAWLATGDLGFIDDSGRVHVTGRRDAMFISGGENIQPEEIENALREVPGVTSASVVAIDDPVWQRRPIAFVAGTFDREVLGPALARALAHLPRFKWPDRVHLMPASEAGLTKPSRFRLTQALDAPVLWERRSLQPPRP
jgi:O-succinylbenzoic acid--CoA ligase